MSMQDNELDDLFCSRLGSLEMEPSANVWTNINAQMGGSKKKSLVPVWSIAASVLILLGIGTWFMLDKPAVTQSTRLTRVKQQPKIEQVKPLKATTVQEADVEDLITQGNTQSGQQISRMAHVKTSKHIVVATRNEPETAMVVKEATPDQPLQILAAVPDRAVLRPVVPEMQLSMPTITEDASTIKALASIVPVMAAVQPKKKKQRIHSLGGLLNVVIAKVDKREDKLIEFTESDDDQANITGINLGIIKVKKDK